MMIDNIEVAKAVIAHESVECFSGKEQGVSEQPRTLVSCVGGVFWGKPGETWPVTTDGKPLIPWLQIVCGEMEDLYGAFHKRKAVCFFIRQDFSDYSARSALDCSDFVVREYGLEDMLVPLKRPDNLAKHPFRQIIWTKRPDYPSVSKYRGLFDRIIYKALCTLLPEQNLDNVSGIKIGGWPSPVQSRQQYPGQYDLQIDITSNWMYGDSGVGYLYRSGERWHVLFECC